MKTLAKTFLVGMLFVLGSSAALAADPAVGNWKLNAAKSTFKPGPAPKSQTRSYAESGQGLMLTLKTVAADGKQSTSTATFKDDGKDYPITGSPDYDTVAVTRVDALTVNATQKKAGAVVAHSVRSVSKDGKELTFKSAGTHADGTKYEDTTVFDRQ